MSHLKLYAPDEHHLPSASDSPQKGDETGEPDEEPVILSFAFFLRQRQADSAQLLNRGRSLHLNRECPYCRHPVVEPLELADGRVGPDRKPIPGSATLVGFHCSRCAAEWPA